MAFADPQVVTINAVAQSMPRVSTGTNTSSYQKDDASYQLIPSHSYGKRTRRVIRLNNTKIAADPFLPAANVKFASSIYLVIDEPTTGYTRAELKLQVDGFLAYLAASSGAQITKLLAGEN